MTTTPIAIWCPPQYDGARPQDLEYEDRFGLLLHPVAWANESPVVTFEAFVHWIAVWAVNDRNGNWGRVYESESPDDGRIMIHVSNDALHQGFTFHPGMTVAEIEQSGQAGEVSWWHVGESGVYRLADHPDWDYWAPLTSFDQFI